MIKSSCLSCLIRAHLNSDWGIIIWKSQPHSLQDIDAKGNYDDEDFKYDKDNHIDDDDDEDDDDKDDGKNLLRSSFSIRALCSCFSESRNNLKQ